LNQIGERGFAGKRLRAETEEMQEFKIQIPQRSNRATRQMFEQFAIGGGRTAK
jgi:hypothetical protein